MSPLLRSVEKAGIEGVKRKSNPQNISADDFFSDAKVVRSMFAQLVKGETERVAIIPSASYGLGNVIRNIKSRPGGKVITVHEEYPSDVYTLYRICDEHQLQLITVRPPDDEKGRGRRWNERLLEAIVPGTVLINLASINWTDGTVFDLEAIGKRAHEVGALFVVDGTQSVGVMEMDVERFHIDALVCAGYKWLLGPYTSGFAWYGSYFDNGIPNEESWMNRPGSDNFSGLTGYEREYLPKAGRYNMGQFSNFINLPMVKAGLTQLQEWTPAAINQYCDQVSTPLIQHINNKGFWIEEAHSRAKHLFGFRLPTHLPIESVRQKLKERNVTVSFRGSAIRVSPHVYNNEKDIKALIECL